MGAIMSSDIAHIIILLIIACELRVVETDYTSMSLHIYFTKGITTRLNNRENQTLKSHDVWKSQPCLLERWNHLPEPRMLNHRGYVTNICVRELDCHWFK